MNAYGNRFGVNTPIESEKLFNLFKEKYKKLELADSSWHNDLTDSICIILDEENDEYIHIFLPNSSMFDIEEELYNTFVISYDVKGKNKEYLANSMYDMINDLEKVFEIIDKKLKEIK
jgi:hypothetical protein